MKHLAFLLFMALAFSASAQKAQFDSKTAKEKVNDNTILYKLSIVELQSAAQAQELAGKMKTLKPVLKVEVLNATATKADFRITTVKEDNLHVLQNALLAANVLDVMIDGKAYRTANLYDVVKGMKKK